ncbi:MAG: hypothetical protein KGL53_16535 [Elusimicrobia bacterium]|nr:hypothetical protein [Elusimicrobiota bacterium]
MRRVLFLLHGVGDHGAGWAERPGGPASALRAVSLRYEAFRRRPLDERVRLVPLSYDELLDAAAARWRAAAARGAGSWARALKERASALVPWSERLAALPGLDGLADALPSLEAAWPSRLSHVAAWRADAACRKAVRERVADGVRAVLLPLAEDGQECSAVLAAHSLGTAVAQDALDDLGRRWARSRSRFAPVRWRWRAVFLLADVGRLLGGADEDALLRSGRDGDPGSWTRRLYEVRHAWDPIDRAAPKTDGRGARPIELDHAWGANVHSFAHYLEHPAVHVPLLRAAAGAGTVTRAEEDEARAEAAARPSVLDETAGALKARLSAGAERVKDLKRLMGGD